MADNTTINPGSGGDTIATDDIGGVKYQRVKVQYGEDGTSSDCSLENPLPANIGFSDSGAIDAFGRLRVASPSTIFDIKQLYDKQSLFFDEDITDNSGNATSTHSTTDAATTMHVENNDTIIRQTKMRYNYQPGKSQLYLLTGVLGAGVSNVRRRIGAFDANDGLFFELNDSTLSVVVRKGASDTSVASASWNIDPMDGTGPSGVTIDTSKAQIFVIDYEWLGVGRVRFGFVVDGKIYYCHHSMHANSVTAVYMSTSNHPVRYETSSTGGTGDLIHICSSVVSEGGFEPLGVLRSHSTGTTHVDASVANTAYAILGIRLKSTHLDAAVIPLNVCAISETNDDFRWVVSLNPTIAGTFTYSNLDNSACQTAAGATANTVSDFGEILAQGYVSTDTLQVSADLHNALRPGSLIDGTPDELVLTVQPLSADTDIQAAINWRELL